MQQKKFSWYIKTGKNGRKKTGRKKTGRKKLDGKNWTKNWTEKTGRKNYLKYQIF